MNIFKDDELSELGKWLLVKIPLGLCLITFLTVSFMNYKYGYSHQLLEKNEILTDDRAKIRTLMDLSELANSGVGDAQGRLAQEFYDGVLVERNNEKSLFWAEKGYESKDPLATLLLARMYFYGEDVPKDKEKAISLMESIKDSRQDAKYILGRMYMNQADNPDILEKGWDLIKQSADEGMFLAQYDYARHLLASASELVANSPAEKKLKKSLEWKSAEYLAMAVTQGYAPATTNLALYFHHGIGVDKNPVKARELMVLAKEMGDEQAKKRLDVNDFGFDYMGDGGTE